MRVNECHITFSIIPVILSESEIIYIYHRAMGMFLCFVNFLSSLWQVHIRFAEFSRFPILFLFYNKIVFLAILHIFQGIFRNMIQFQHQQELQSALKTSQWIFPKLKSHHSW